MGFARIWKTLIFKKTDEAVFSLFNIFRKFKNFRNISFTDSKLSNVENFGNRLI